MSKSKRQCCNGLKVAKGQKRPIFGINISATSRPVMKWVIEKTAETMVAVMMNGWMIKFWNKSDSKSWNLERLPPKDNSMPWNRMLSKDKITANFLLNYKYWNQFFVVVLVKVTWQKTLSYVLYLVKLINKCKLQLLLIQWESQHKIQKLELSFLKAVCQCIGHCFKKISMILSLQIMH